MRDRASRSFGAKGTAQATWLGHTIVVARKRRAMDPPWLGWVRGELEQGIQTFYEA
jgi:hypothetical protein